MTAQEYWERALQGGKWLAEQQNRDGSWKELSEPMVDAFYKGGWPLVLTGQTAAELAGISRLTYPKNVRLIRVMCTGMVDTQYVIKAFLEGADGVLVSGRTMIPGADQFLRCDRLDRARGAHRHERRRGDRPVRRVERADAGRAVGGLDTEFHEPAVSARRVTNMASP